MIFKIFNSQDSVDSILDALRDDGLVVFSDTTSIFIKFYREQLQPLLDSSIIQAFTMHPHDGYFYFLYNCDKYSLEQAQKFTAKFKH
jgi:hypothetical protein